MVNTVKFKLLKRIEALENDELLAALSNEISYFQGEADVLDAISSTNQEELRYLVNEPFRFETESDAEFKKATEKWRIR